MNKVLQIIGLLALVALGWLGGSYFPFGFAKGHGNEPQRDTLYVHDTMRIYKPKEIEVVPSGYDLVPIGYTDSVGRQIRALEDSLERKPKIVYKDSLLYIEIPMEQKHYADSTYDAWVSGYRPSLDSLNIYKRTMVIVETKTIEAPAKRWGLGVSAGYGVSKDGLSPYIGLGISYSILKW